MLSLIFSDIFSSNSIDIFSDISSVIFLIIILCFISWHLFLILFSNIFKIYFLISFHKISFNILSNFSSKIVRDIFLPPVRWGLLDFIELSFFFFPSSSAFSFLLFAVIFAIIFARLQHGAPDLVCSTGPHRGTPERSVQRRTSPGELPSGVCSAGSHPGAPERSVQRRASPDKRYVKRYAKKDCQKYIRQKSQKICQKK